MTENKAIDETFEDYIRNERDKFVLSMNRWYSDNVPARVAAENIIIAYDQMRDKLEEYAQQLATSLPKLKSDVYDAAKQRYDERFVMFAETEEDVNDNITDRQYYTFGYVDGYYAAKGEDIFKKIKDEIKTITDTHKPDEQPAERAAQTDVAPEPEYLIYKEESGMIHGWYRCSPIEYESWAGEKRIINPKKPDVATDDDWISVEDRLPNEDQKVIVNVCDVFGDNFILIARRNNGEWYAPFKPCDGITHWRPLPKPPKQ